MAEQPVAAVTVGEIAKRLGEPLHRVQYVIRSREINPAARAGNIRVFTEQQFHYIAAELRRMDSDGTSSSESPIE